MEQRRPERGTGSGVRRTVLDIAALVGAFYAVPGLGSGTAGLFWLRAGGGLVVASGLLWLVVREAVRESRVSKAERRLRHLTLTVIAGVVLFAYADQQVAALASGQFVGLRTRTDALYFAMTTLTTVGYGDMYAVGQLGRGLVIIQLLFNVVVVAQAVSALTAAAKYQRRGHDTS